MLQHGSVAGKTLAFLSFLKADLIGVTPFQEKQYGSAVIPQQGRRPPNFRKLRQPLTVFLLDFTRCSCCLKSSVLSHLAVLWLA